MFDMLALAEGEELGSNILHLETPEIQPIRTTSAPPCAAMAAARRSGRGGKPETPIISFCHLFSWEVFVTGDARHSRVMAYEKRLQRAVVLVVDLVRAIEAVIAS